MAQPFLEEDMGSNEKTNQRKTKERITTDKKSSTGRK